MRPYICRLCWHTLSCTVRSYVNSGVSDRQGTRCRCSRHKWNDASDVGVLPCVWVRPVFVSECCYHFPLYNLEYIVVLTLVSVYWERRQKPLLTTISYSIFLQLLHCMLASCGTVYCNRSCLWVCVFVGVCLCGCVSLWVCYHDNSKLHASILTKLGL